MAPLRRRLQRIEGIKVSTPEKGVRIAQDVFGQKIEVKESDMPNKTIIGSMELVEIIGKANKKVVAKIDPTVEKSVLDRVVAAEMQLEAKEKIKFNLKDERVQTIVDLVDLSHQKYRMVIGARDLRDFLIDPSKHTEGLRGAKTEAEKCATLIPYMVRKLSEEEVRELDVELADIDSSIKLLAHLRPENIAQEKEIFLAHPSYNPHFEYKPLRFDPNNLYARLRRLEFPDTPIGLLLRKKADEVQRKIQLIEARGSDHFTVQSVYLYDAPDEKLLNEAIAEVSHMPKEFKKSGTVLTSKEAKKQFEQAIKDFGLKSWSVKIKKEMVADALAGKENSVLLRADATFTPERLKGTIAHEIETHVFRAMNGALQPYKIFQRGLAGYLTTEEGLAIYNQERTESSETEKKYWPASSVIGIYKALRGSFLDVFHEVMHQGFDAERAWKVAIKAKRGLIDTSKPGAFTKDFVYFKGHREILDFVKNGGSIKDLYYGKITLKDLETVKKVKGLKTPIYLPAYLHVKMVDK